MHADLLITYQVVFGIIDFFYS